MHNSFIFTDDEPEQESLEGLFLDRIDMGLSRSSLTRCSDWASKYRVMGKPYPGPWSFAHLPWLEDMHNSEAELNIGQKSAQMGFTELLMNWSFFSIDILGESVLYVLPTDDNAGDFSAGRFDPALDLSPHLEKLFNDVKNTKLKRAGSACLYVRGSRSKTNLISIPVARIAVDEVNKMVVSNIPLLMERMSGQISKQVWMISTPTIPGYGISKFYDQSTQEHFFFKCPHCSRMIELLFPENVVICGDNPYDKRISESHYICTECKAKLEHATKDMWMDKGIWVPKTDASARGFYINQLYSRSISPSELVTQYFQAQIDPASEQELYNSKLGLAHVVAGARIEETDLQGCVGEFFNHASASSNNIITMGVDVGTWLHFEINEWLPSARFSDSDIHLNMIPRVVYSGRVKDFSELDNLMSTYGVQYCVVDANPERREALKFCARFYGRASACFYGRDQKTREITVGSNLPTITVDRTSWLDLSLSRFKGKRIKLPADIGQEYRDHMKAIVKVYEKDSDGNGVATFVNVGPDHSAHARNYAEIALDMAISSGNITDISGVM
jgi:hypothetical protein